MDTESIATLQAIAETKLIKAPQLILLLMANKHMEGWTTADITKATGIAASAVTMAKRKLLAQGFIIEHCPHRDRRVTKAYLTDSGRSEASRAWRLLRELLRSEGVIRSASSI